MRGRWIVASDMALTRAGAKLLRLEPVEFRDDQHVGLVVPGYSVHMFAPGYIGIAAAAGALHFIPLPQPWGLLTYGVLSYFFGLAVFHICIALLGRFTEGRVLSDGSDTVASGIGAISCLVSLILFSFLAPSPLDLLYR